MKKIVGQRTSGQETLVGTQWDEVFEPLGGLDIVLGGGGVDTVFVLDVSTRYKVANNGHVNYLDATSGASAQALRMEDVSFLQFTDKTIPLWNGNTIRSGPNDDPIMGGSGVDRLVVDARQANYTLKSTGTDAWTLTDNLNTTGVDQLEYMDRIVFTDGGYSLDLQATQSGGKTAELLHILLGTTGLRNPQLVNIGLMLFDQGLTLETVSQLAVTAKLCPADDAALVRTVWRNAVGTEIDSSNLGIFVAQLEAGQITPAGLIAMAAAHPLHLAQLQLTGIYQSGLSFEVALAG
jgi:hypothetical protein